MTRRPLARLKAHPALTLGTPGASGQVRTDVGRSYRLRSPAE